MKHIIITGATSGIGEAVTRVLIDRGLHLGLIGRNTQKLKELQNLAPDRIVIQCIDLLNTEQAILQFRMLLQEMGHCDTLILNAGISSSNPNFDFEIDKPLINVNVQSFVALADEGMKLFIQQGYGHLVGVSSVSAYSGSKNFVYSASKAFIATYLDNIRINMAEKNLPIFVTEVIPGYIHTGITEDKNRTFWLVEPHEIAPQFVHAVEKGQSKVYLPHIWKWVVLLLRCIPKQLRCYLVRKHFFKKR